MYPELSCVSLSLYDTVFGGRSTALSRHHFELQPARYSYSAIENIRCEKKIINSFTTHNRYWKTVSESQIPAD